MVTDIKICDDYVVITEEGKDYVWCAQIRTYNPSGWDTHTGKIQPITRK